MRHGCGTSEVIQCEVKVAFSQAFPVLRVGDHINSGRALVSHKA